jgi:hypothetical protein
MAGTSGLACFRQISKLQPYNLFANSEQQMLKDIHLRFNGFHGSAGRCQIRMARQSKVKPLVIICSQYKNYYGTSVTNALEIIAETLFHEIANDQISGISLDHPLAVRKIWHRDANLFDKLLSGLFPLKYGSRFSTTRLNLIETFSKVVWIENYPIDAKSFAFDKHCHMVTFDGQGNPSWHGRPSDDWLIRKTGFSSSELLPQDELLNLTEVENTLEILPRSEEELRSFPGYHLVRWTKELIDFLPGLLSSARSRRGRTGKSDLEEYSVHDEIEEFLAVRLPARELFTREFPFSKEIGIYEGGKEKTVDFAIFAAEGGKIDSLLEVKRSSKSSDKLSTEVKKDLARLLILSQHFKCNCYLLVCGDTDSIGDQLSGLEQYISLVDTDEKRDRRFTVTDSDFDREYRKLLHKFELSAGVSKLQGENSNGSNTTILWQIAANEQHLSTHKPYEFNISGVTLHQFF